MKINKWMKRAAGMLAALTFIVSVASVSVVAQEYDNGAYLVPVTVSYAHPRTGEIVDGGSNEALGNSMSQSIVESQALVEVSGDEIYVTLGLGLASNIGNVEILTESQSGSESYLSPGLTVTGTCVRDGDTCNHYRFPMSDPRGLISPILYVTPMGRDVQFFVQLNMDGRTLGTGNFLSEMVAEDQDMVDVASLQIQEETNAQEGSDIEETTVEETAEVETTQETPDLTEESQTETKDNETEDLESAESEVPESEEKEEKKTKQSNAPIYIGIAVVVIAIVAALGVIFIKKRKK
ncbi:MAG TPA: hypothetical protein IAC41_03160 [Candidatus Merdenecus merdavium]|nr:hypothetical protein [Candidatus Merdenecus merdavium]